MRTCLIFFCSIHTVNTYICAYEIHTSLHFNENICTPMDIILVFTYCVKIFLHHSMVVRVKRKCMAMSQWTPVDFSGCTLSSNDQNVIVILSLWAVITSSSNGEEINIQSLEELVYAHIPSLSSYVITLLACSKEFGLLHCK